MTICHFIHAVNIHCLILSMNKMKKINRLWAFIHMPEQNLSQKYNYSLYE